MILAKHSWKCLPHAMKTWANTSEEVHTKSEGQRRMFENLEIFSVSEIHYFTESAKSGQTRNATHEGE